MGSHSKVMIQEVGSSRILPICSSIELQLYISPPPSWRYLSCHGELLLLFNLCGGNLRIMLLILVLFLQRTLGCIVAYLATSEALHLGDILLSSLFPLFSLRCKGYVILLLYFGL